MEAILLVIDEPVRPKLLAQVLDTPEPQVDACLRGLQAEYDAQQRGFELREVAGDGGSTRGRSSLLSSSGSCSTDNRHG